MEELLTDMKFKAWEVLRAGSLARVMSGAEIARATEKGISTEGMTCVRFLAEADHALIEIKVVIDAPGMTPAEAIEEARRLVAGKRIDID